MGNCCFLSLDAIADHIDRGDLCVEKKNYAGALTNFKFVYDNVSDNHSWKSHSAERIGMVYAKSKQYGIAIEYYTEVAKSRLDANVALNLARCYVMQNQLEQAKRLLDKVHQISPINSELYRMVLDPQSRYVIDYPELLLAQVGQASSRL